MFHVVCVRAGTAFGPEYVNILFDSVRRNLPEGFVGEFVCFTDQPDELADGIVVRHLPADLPGWWSKLALFRPGLFPEGDRILYLDLGCVITGRLDELAAYAGPFAILRDFYRPDGLQSSVMAWESGTNTAIWQSYEAAGCPTDDDGGDQAWIETYFRADMVIADHDTVRGPVTRLQDQFPGLFASFKADNLDRNPPEKASIVVFHGLPKPIDLRTGWVPQVWCLGGMSRADLDVICNVAKEAILDQVRSACKRGLIWLDTVPEHDGHVCIVGGGPSLVDCLDELRWRQSIGQRVWALNGAARFLYGHGVIADVQIIADAREENAEFIPSGYLPDLNTVAYLASQCHPEVFDRATAVGLGIILWHANTEGMSELLKDEKRRPVHLIGGGTTVGMNAIVLAFARGYRKIHLYGFDSSFRDDHHAYSQPGNDGDRVIDALYNGERFKTTAWMAQQVNDFQALVPTLVSDGCIITVAGDGLLPAVAKDMAENMPMTPAQVRAHEVLKRLNGAAEPHGVEVGVFAGDMSAALLRGHPDLRLDMVDSWEGEGAAYTGDSGDFHAGLSQSAQDGFYDRAIAKVAFARDRANILRKRSVEAAESVPDASCDFVFLDADHSFSGCYFDIVAWSRKVKPGGWLGGHDYANTDFPKFGVTEAVDKFVAMDGKTLELGENFTWFIQRPA